jgi:hypothetical protein
MWWLVAAVAVIPPTAIAADPPDSKPKKAETTHAVPYRLTETNHVLVRLKLNGKGPYNFILDTGAPAVFITKAIAKKVGLTPDAKGWGQFDSFEIEGGLKVDKARCRVEDLFQLDGMNGLGLAGVELHGVVGYNVLARFRITYDFTGDKLAFVPLDYDPPDPKGIGGKGQGGLEMIGTMTKMIAGMMNVKPNFDVKPNGFLGLELEESKDGLTVKTVLKGGPADQAGIKAGDRLESIKTTTVDDAPALKKAVNKASVGDKLSVTVVRGGEKQTVTVELGKGL